MFFGKIYLLIFESTRLVPDFKEFGKNGLFYNFQLSDVWKFVSPFHRTNFVLEIWIVFAEKIHREPVHCSPTWASNILKNNSWTRLYVRCTALRGRPGFENIWYSLFSTLKVIFLQKDCRNFFHEGHNHQYSKRRGCFVIGSRWFKSWHSRQGTMMPKILNWWFSKSKFKANSLYNHLLIFIHQFFARVLSPCRTAFSKKYLAHWFFQ